jgi:nucleoside 2-deoxyribosyltransferase
MRVYISGALKASRDLVAARKLYEYAATSVRRVGVEPYLPHATTDPEKEADLSPQSVYHTDVTALRSCQAVIAFLDEPSLGVGAELAICAQDDIPVLGLCRSPQEVSRFAIGCLLDSGGQLASYRTEEQLDVHIDGFIQSLSEVGRKQAMPADPPTPEQPGA